MGLDRILSVEEVSKHATPKDCWIVIDGKVWDFTDFAPDHPGGPDIVYQYAGRDGTAIYNANHAPTLLARTLPSSKCLGTLSTSTKPATCTRPPPTTTPSLTLNASLPPLSTVLNASDFTTIASRTLTPKTWAFYSSAATDCVTERANRELWERVWFQPRVMRDVRECDVRTRMLGVDCAVPFFVAPAAMARLVNEEGERALGRGAVGRGVGMCISTNASFPIEDIIPESARGSHPFFLQLYVNKDRSKSEALLKRVEGLGVKGIFVTVDAPVIGKREADERVRADESLSSPMSGATAKNDAKGGGLGRIMGGYIDASLNWEDLKWLRRVTKLPIVLKGVQTAADARRAMEEGCEGIVLSNHGGRSLDTSPPALLVLLEIQMQCSEVFEKMEVYVDGGIRRGSDILKALCLGATAVGLGRPFLYALNYGQEGVEHLIEILKDELETSMRMVGITSLSQAHPGLINTLDIDHMVPSTEGHPYAKGIPKARL